MINTGEPLPIAAVVPTCDRPEALRRTLESLSAQEVALSELVFVDASADHVSRDVVEAFAPLFGSRGCRTRWEAALTAGAAAQRNQGVAVATQPFVLFFDDDIFLDSFCLSRLWEALLADPGLGGVNAMIKNQRYQSPGRVSCTMFRIMAGKRLPSYAGKVLGPAFG
jgi:glycosyltransferase involved in cell wall biosynthesis